MSDVLLLFDKRQTSISLYLSHHTQGMWAERERPSYVAPR